MRLALAGAVAAATAVTFVVTLVPSLRFAYRAPALHVAIETAAAVIGLLGAYLAAGRFHRRRRLDDVLLAVALAVLAGTNLAFGAVPAALGAAATPFLTWTTVVGRVVGGFLFTATALAPAQRHVRSPRALRTAVAVPIVVLVVATAAIAILHDALPLGVEADAPPESSGRPRLVGHPAVLAVQLVLTTLYALAAVCFARRFERERDEMTAWLAVAAVLGAFSRLNYFLYPSLYTEWVYTGDVFRLLFYTAIMVAAAREIGSYWHAVAEAARLEERRRLARDLHDGLAQELAFVGRNLTRLDRAEDDWVLQRIRSGADRALAESRRAIAALTEPLDRPLEEAIEEAAHQTAAREGTHVAVATAPAGDVGPEVRDALVRITSEAVTNAARHSGADFVRVTLDAGDRLSLRIADPGRGFDAGAVRRGAFGLTSMRERAEAVGGRLRITSAPGEGTEVEVVL